MDDLRKRAWTLLAVVVVGLLFLYPTIRVSVERWLGREVSTAELLGQSWISRPIALGLDLSGGVHLLYKVLTDEAVTGHLQVTANSIRSELSTKGKIAVTKARVINKYEVEITLLSARQVEQARAMVGDNHKELVFLRQENAEAERVQLIYTVQEKEALAIRRSAVTRAVETLRNRVDKFGVAEPLIQRKGDDRILLQLAGVQDIEGVKKLVGRVAKLEFRMLPRSENAPGTVTMKDRKTGGPIKVEDTVQLTGEYVQDAQVTSDRMGLREVLLSFTNEGGRLFAKVSGENVGRQMAIILDGEVYSAPVIQERIAGGRCSITGDFNIEEARDLAIVLKSGALPAPLEVLEERTVGPTLGVESIRNGILAIAVSCLLVFIFMVFYYRKSGCLACGTLLLNLFLMLAALSAFGATLTLPGLAGLALTIGMAVDSNVIIFERIRDEIRNGATRDAAVESGFHKALSAILDSNITTLLAGLVLYFFGTGPIRGFAVTLSIGVLTTIFCATFVSRLGFNFFRLEGKETLSI